MQLKYLIAAVASLTVASAIAIPEPQDAATPTFKCGCTNGCKLANKPGVLCPEYCDPAYLCPATPTQTPIRVTETCGPCLNDCLVGCPDLRLCKCAAFCDPKYFCPSTTIKPTPKPTFVCGCTNDCIINCPPGKNCICPAYCDPKYECPGPTAITLPSVITIRPTITDKPSVTRITVPVPRPTCGCLNDCQVNCPKGENCICPLYCDPKYACPTLLTKAKLAKKSIVPVPTPITTGIPCGCHNDCTISCRKKGCACPAWCDPKYACIV